MPPYQNLGLPTAHLRPPTVNTRNMGNHVPRNLRAHYPVNGAELVANSPRRLITSGRDKIQSADTPDFLKKTNTPDFLKKTNTPDFLRKTTLYKILNHMNSENPREQNRTEKPQTLRGGLRELLGPHADHTDAHHFHITKEDLDQKRAFRFLSPASKSTSRIPSPIHKQPTQNASALHEQAISPSNPPKPTQHQLPTPSHEHTSPKHRLPQTPHALHHLPRPISILISLLIAISAWAIILLAIALIISNGNLRLFFP